MWLPPSALRVKAKSKDAATEFSMESYHYKPKVRTESGEEDVVMMASNYRDGNSAEESMHHIFAC